MSCMSSELSCWTVTHDESSDGEIDVGRGFRLERVSLMYETHDGQCILDSRNEVVTKYVGATACAILSG
jgi:hypothetical protein